MKKLTATYTGRNGTTGYHNATTYDLIIRGGQFEYIVVTDLKGERLCQYINVIDFLNNWTNITKFKTL